MFWQWCCSARKNAHLIEPLVSLGSRKRLISRFTALRYGREFSLEVNPQIITNFVIFAFLYRYDQQFNLFNKSLPNLKIHGS
jgi:hypothetical protein